MVPSEVRTRLLYEHRLLRETFDEVEDLARDVLEQKDADPDGLYREIADLVRDLRAHMQLEEQWVLPILRELGEEARNGLACFQHAHRSEADVLDLLGQALESRSRSPIELALLTRGFLAMMREDLTEEEGFVLSRALFANGAEEERTA